MVHSDFSACGRWVSLCGGMALGHLLHVKASRDGEFIQMVNTTDFAILHSIYLCVCVRVKHYNFMVIKELLGIFFNFCLTSCAENIYSWKIISVRLEFKLMYISVQWNQKLHSRDHFWKPKRISNNFALAFSFLSNFFFFF